jgi:ribose 5-phosphate isomerase B
MLATACGRRPVPGSGAGIAILRLGRLAGAVRIAIASDHAGFRLKSIVIDHLRSAGHVVDDLGTHSEEPVDYPPFCAAAARKVVTGRAERGIVIGGSGQGEAMAANKVRGVRAALCHDETTARLARFHNDANILSLGQRIVGPDLALAIVDAFLAGAFEGGRHVARLAEITAIENEEAAGTRLPGAGAG